MPFFNTISGKELAIDIFSNPILAAGLAGIVAVVGILSGIYPAVVLSGFRPVETLRGTLSGGSKKSAFRVVLVSFQFTATIVLIIGTLVIKNQLDYVKNKKLGYDKEQIITFRMRNEATRQKFETIKNELLAHPNIISATASNSLPLGSNNSGAHHPVGEPEDNIILLYGQTVDNDYFDTFGIDIIKGRGFSKDHPTDFTDAALINETTMKQLGWESDPLGRQIEMYTGIESRKAFTIIGVVKDYHFESLQNEIRPLMLYNSTPFGSEYYIMSVKVKPDNIQDTVEYLKTKWAEFDPQYPFEYSFFNEQYNDLYKKEERMGSLFGYFALLAIMIGVIGLFGLASFSAEKCTKEVGIRKVLGSSVGGIVVLMTKDFMKWVLIANVFAWPIAYYGVNWWLQNFAYRIDIGFRPFAVAGSMALVIAFVTVSYQALKSAYANPVDSLRHE